MKLPTLPTLLSAFFLRYLAVERGVSPHTTTSYRDAMKLLLQFAAGRCRRAVEQRLIDRVVAAAVLGRVAGQVVERLLQRRARIGGPFRAIAWPRSETEALQREGSV